MASDGYLKLHRKLMDSDVFGDSKLLHVWVWCLLRANYTPQKWRGQVVPVGSFVTGRNAAAEALGMTPSTVYRLLNKLKGLGMVELHPNNKWTRVSICNWGTYQTEPPAERTSNEHQMDTIERKKERKKKSSLSTPAEIAFDAVDGLGVWGESFIVDSLTRWAEYRQAVNDPTNAIALREQLLAIGQAGRQRSDVPAIVAACIADEKRRLYADADKPRAAARNSSSRYEREDDLL